MMAFRFALSFLGSPVPAEDASGVPFGICCGDSCRRKMDSKSEEIPSITVTGEAVLVRKPDVAYVNLFVRSDGTLLQDALRENAATVDQVRQALLEGYPEIRDIEIQDVFMGEGRHATGLVGDKATIARPEVIRSFLVTIPPDQVLGI